MDKRGGNYSYNPKFRFQDMCDMYLMSGQFRDSLLEPAVKGYYDSQKDMAGRLESALLNIDFSYWPQVESRILKSLTEYSRLRCGKFSLFLNILHTLKVRE